MSTSGQGRQGSVAGWAVILGVSEGTGAAIARAVARDPGLDVFGAHRGHHPEAAALLEQEVTAAGRRVVLRAADAGTAEGARRGVEELLAAAGPGSVRLFVHSLASASMGRLAAGAGPASHRARSRRPSTSWRTRSSTGRRRWWRAGCSRRARGSSGSPTRSTTRWWAASGSSRRPRARSRPTCARWRWSSGRSATASTCSSSPRW